MPTPRRSPPTLRFVFRMLGWLLPPRIRDPLVGDLEEEYRQRAAIAPLRARLWAWSQVIRSLGAAVRLRRGPALLAVGLTFARRSLVRAPGFSIAVVATLALGIGANATIYAAVDRLLLRAPEHVADPDRVAHVFFQRQGVFPGQPETTPNSSYPDLVDFQDVNAFQAIAGWSNESRTFGDGEGAERIPVQIAGGSMFEVLGVQPWRGRFFRPDEDRVGGPKVAVLSHGFWTRRFGASDAVLGTDIRLGPGRWTIVGVAPPGFTGPALDKVDVWLPLLTAQSESGRTAWVDSRDLYWFRNVARLAPGLGAAAAEDEATAAHRSGRSREIAEGRYDAAARVVLAPLVAGSAPDAGGEIEVARWLAGVSIIVLLIACANVANLLLARGVRRRREWAVHRALGMSRGRLVGVLVIEVGVLASLAAAAAVVVARVGSVLLYRTLLPDLDPQHVLVGPRLLLFTAAVAAAATLLAGVGPAMVTARAGLAADLKRPDARAGAASRTRTGLVVAQVALSTVLLVGAGLFVRSLMAASRLDFGFAIDGVVTGTPEMNTGAVEGEPSEAAVAALARLEGDPRIAAGAATSLAPFSGWRRQPFGTDALDSVAVPQGPYVYAVTPGYFEAMGMDVMLGRGFTSTDADEGASPVSVLTADLARQAFGTDDPLGRCIRVGAGAAPACTRVVGVLADHRLRDLEEEGSFLYYLPRGHPSTLGGRGIRTVVVRARSSTTDAVVAVREALLAEPGVRYADVAPLADRVDRHTQTWSMGASLFSVFGVLAAVVAGLGVFALLSFDVARSRRDLAVRSALGASAGGLARRVLVRALGSTALGISLGLAAALVLSFRMQPLLFHADPLDPWVPGAVALLLMGVAAAAALVPAGRAGRVPPAEVLRSE